MFPGFSWFLLVVRGSSVLSGACSLVIFCFFVVVAHWGPFNICVTNLHGSRPQVRRSRISACPVGPVRRGIYCRCPGLTAGPRRRSSSDPPNPETTPLYATQRFSGKPPSYFFSFKTKGTNVSPELHTGGVVSGDLGLQLKDPGTPTGH